MLVLELAGEVVTLRWKRQVEQEHGDDIKFVQRCTVTDEATEKTEPAMKEQHKTYIIEIHQQCFVDVQAFVIKTANHLKITKLCFIQIYNHTESVYGLPVSKRKSM